MRWERTESVDRLGGALPAVAAMFCLEDERESPAMELAEGFLLKSEVGGLTWAVGVAERWVISSRKSRTDCAS